jgi:hypothetical protein
MSRYLPSRLFAILKSTLHPAVTSRRQYASVPKYLTQPSPNARILRQPPPANTESEEGKDFRPPWFFTGTRLATALIIPGVQSSHHHNFEHL